MMTEGFKPLCDVFHRATYKDVGMALNLNRLILSAPSCIIKKSCIIHFEDPLNSLMPDMTIKCSLRSTERRHCR
jgi:hypothetical protein